MGALRFSGVLVNWHCFRGGELEIRDPQFYTEIRDRDSDAARVCRKHGSGSVVQGRASLGTQGDGLLVAHVLFSIARTWVARGTRHRAFGVYGLVCKVPLEAWRSCVANTRIPSGPSKVQPMRSFGEVLGLREHTRRDRGGPSVAQLAPMYRWSAKLCLHLLGQAVCLKCGTPHAADAKFCRKCGQKREQAQRAAQSSHCCFPYVVYVASGICAGIRAGSPADHRGVACARCLSCDQASHHPVSVALWDRQASPPASLLRSRSARTEDERCFLRYAACTPGAGDVDCRASSTLSLHTLRDFRQFSQRNTA